MFSVSSSVLLIPTALLWPHAASSSSVFFPGHPSSPVICFCPFKKLIGQKQITGLQKVMQGSWGPGGQLREGHEESRQCQECQISLLSLEEITTIIQTLMKLKKPPSRPLRLQSVNPNLHCLDYLGKLKINLSPKEPDSTVSVFRRHMRYRDAVLLSVTTAFCPQILVSSPSFQIISPSSLFPSITRHRLSYHFMSAQSHLSHLTLSTYHFVKAIHGGHFSPSILSCPFSLSLFKAGS